MKVVVGLATTGGVLAVAAALLAIVGSAPPSTGGRTFAAVPARLALAVPETLKADRVFGEGDTLGAVQALEFVGDSIIVLDAKPLASSDYLLRFDRETGELVESTGPPGQGPKDIGYPQALSVDLDGRLWVYDYSNARLARYNAANLLAGPLETLSTEVGQFHQPTWIGRRAFLSNGVFPEELLRFYSVVGGVVELVGAAGRPPVEDLAANVAVQVNRNRIAYDPNRELVAVGFMMLSRIHIYSVGGDLMRSIAGPDEIQLRYNVGTTRSGGPRFAPQSDTQIAYVDVAASHEYIFAAFSGKSFADETTYHIADFLHVFRWDGTFVGSWNLEHGVIKLKFDRVQGRLWGVRENPSPALVRFEAVPPE